MTTPTDSLSPPASGPQAPAGSGSGTVAVRRALISVSDKNGLADTGRRLAALGIELISTGGTARALKAEGLAVTDVSALTGMAEMMDGRVKTLHPAIHGGLLMRAGHEGDAADAGAAGIAPIDLVIVNLYPFEQTVAEGAGFAETVEQIDIGGPAMIRAAAKNMDRVTVCTSATSTGRVLDALEADGAVPAALRQELAAEAFARTAAYDAAIAAWHGMQLDAPAAPALRYGENPHQRAAFFRSNAARPGVATARQVQGKALSYNNINDTDAAFEALAEIADGRPAAVIVKHANPCGAALGATLEEAYRQALTTDPVSAFGGIVALSEPLDEAAARAVTEIFTEVVIAPDADDAALEVFSRKRNLRLLLTGALPDPSASGHTVRSVSGGLLVQARDNGQVTPDGLEVVTKRTPSDAEMRDLLFAWRVAKHVKSNTIVYAKDEVTAAVGAGQMSRVDAARIAARKARDAAEAADWDAPRTQGSAAASDAFFPFADGLLAVAEAGATSVIQPGGSRRDPEVIAAADEAGLAMVFTGMRHFRH